MPKKHKKGIPADRTAALHLLWRSYGWSAVHGVIYYRCYRKDNTDRMPLDTEGNRQPCPCPYVKADKIEPVIWDAIGQLIKNPDFLIQELHKRNSGTSNTKEILEQELRLCITRLGAIPQEQKRLVDGYRKGLYADFMMRESMEAVQKEQIGLEETKG